MNAEQMVQFRLEHKMSVADAEKKIASYKKSIGKLIPNIKKNIYKKSKTL